MPYSGGRFRAIRGDGHRAEGLCNIHLALKNDGTVNAGGFNDYGQLGDGTWTERSTLVTVPGLSGAVAIARGGDHSLALKSDGSVVYLGVLITTADWATGQTTNRNTPVAVSGLTGVTAIFDVVVQSFAL